MTTTEALRAANSLRFHGHGRMADCILMLAISDPDSLGTISLADLGLDPFSGVESPTSKQGWQSLQRSKHERKDQHLPH